MSNSTFDTLASYRRLYDEGKQSALQSEECHIHAILEALPDILETPNDLRHMSAMLLRRLATVREDLEALRSSINRASKPEGA